MQMFVACSVIGEVWTGLLCPIAAVCTEFCAVSPYPDSLSMQCNVIKV
jgi:hypothetical protein